MPINALIFIVGLLLLASLCCLFWMKYHKEKKESKIYKNQHTYAYTLYAEEDNEEKDILVYVVSPERLSDEEVEATKIGILNKINAESLDIQYEEVGVVYIGINNDRRN